MDKKDNLVAVENKLENNLDVKNNIGNFAISKDIFGIGKATNAISQVILKLKGPSLMKEEVETLEYAIDKINKIDGITNLQKKYMIDNLINNAEKEKNRNNILQKSIEYINEENISDEFIDGDFLNMFYEGASNVSNEELQKIWAKILANEIENPNNYSIRTLAFLRTISYKEANVIKKFIELAISSDVSAYLIDDRNLLEKYGLKFLDILLLEELGLVKQDLRLTIKKGESMFYIDDKYAMHIVENSDNNSIKIIKTTTIGYEIYKTFNEKELNLDYIKDLSNLIKKDSTTIKLIKNWKKLNGGKISYEGYIEL